MAEEFQDSSTSLLPLIINDDGHFFKDEVIYYGNANLSFKFSDQILLTEYAHLSINNGLIDNSHIPPFKPPNLLIDNEIPAAFLYNSILNYSAKNGNKLLKKVVIKGNHESQFQKLDKNYATGLFSGGIPNNLLVGDDPNALNNFTIFQYPEHKVADLEIVNPLSINPTVQWRNIPVKFFLNNNESTMQNIREIGMRNFIM